MTERSPTPSPESADAAPGPRLAVSFILAFVVANCGAPVSTKAAPGQDGAGVLDAGGAAEPPADSSPDGSSATGAAMDSAGTLSADAEQDVAAGADTVIVEAAMPIRYLVILVKENHTFDNYFHGFPGSDTATSGTLSTGAMQALIPAPAGASELVVREKPPLGWKNLTISASNGRR